MVGIRAALLARVGGLTLFVRVRAFGGFLL